jgi:hypothetical protein
MPRRRLIVPPVVAVLAVAVGVAWYAHPRSAGMRRTLPARALIREVSVAYGEEHPHILRLEKTFTDSEPHEPVYFVHLSGRFRRGRLTAGELYFSALADRPVIWGIQGYVGTGAGRHNAWMDCIRAGCVGALP